MGKTPFERVELPPDDAPGYHYYHIYGLRLASMPECPELQIAVPDTPDLVVRFGQVQWDAAPVPASGLARQIRPGSFLLIIPGVARFQIEDDCQIVIAPDEEATPAAIRLFLLGSAMGALLHQRGVTPLHGSAIATPQGAVIFTAPRGYGKSTLAAAFAQRGYPLLADDVCALAVDDAGVRLHPAYPRINLLPDALAALELAPVTDGAQEPLMKPFSNKYCVPVGDFAQGAYPLRTIYRLSPAACDRVQLQRLYGFTRISELMGSTYRVHFLRELGEEARHFEQLQQIARQVDFVGVERPQDGYRLDELVDAIEADFNRG
jgi:hypothetical protein